MNYRFIGSWTISNAPFRDICSLWKYHDPETWV